MSDDMISFETLLAYVDGALTSEGQVRVERAMAGDPTILKKVHDLRADKALLQEALAVDPADPLPAALLDKIATLPLGPVNTNRASARLLGVVALAACLVLAVMGYGGLKYIDYRVGRDIAVQQARWEEDQRYESVAIQVALEGNLSGNELTWANPDSGAQGMIVPVRTFKTEQGQWCREFESKVDRQGAIQDVRAIACREADGFWQTRLQLFEDS